MKNIFKLIYYPKKIVADEILADSIENKKQNVIKIFMIISVLTVIDTILFSYSPLFLSFFGSPSVKSLISSIIYSLGIIMGLSIVFSGFVFIILNIFGNNKDISEEYLQKSGKRNSFLNNLLSISISILFFEIISFIIIFIYFNFFKIPFLIFFAPILALVFFIHNLVIYGSMLSAILNSKLKASIIIIFTLILSYFSYIYLHNYYEEKRRIEVLENFEKEKLNFGANYEN